MATNTLANITTVTAASLANLAGLVPGDFDDQPDGARPRLIEAQVL